MVPHQRQPEKRGFDQHELREYERILCQLLLEEDGRFQAFSPAQLLPQRYPDVHERQIEENNRAWARERKARVEGQVQRVRMHLDCYSRGTPPGEATNGRKQKVWCVELRRCFESLSQAARLSGRTPGNVLQSIRFGWRCGPFHWELFDPQRHDPDPPAPSAA
jgi:hypothetical protein